LIEIVLGHSFLLDLAIINWYSPEVIREIGYAFSHWRPNWRNVSAEIEVFVKFSSCPIFLLKSEDLTSKLKNCNAAR